MLPFDSLKTFLAAADSLSFTRAGREVHRTQSAVSMQIKRLEEEVGQKLFERSGREIRLTRHGETLSLYVRRLLDLHDEALASVSTPDLCGQIRLGAMEDYASRFLPKILASFASVYPQVQVDVVCDDSPVLNEAVDRKELDLVVLTCGRIPDKGLLIQREPVVWATSPHHRAHEKDPLPLAVFHESCIYRQWACQALEAVRRPYRIAYTSASTAGVLAAVVAGLAVAPVGLSSMLPDLRQLGTEDGFPVLPIASIVLKKAEGPQSPVVEALGAVVAEGFQKIRSV